MTFYGLKKTFPKKKSEKPLEKAESSPKEHDLIAMSQAMHLEAIDENMLRLSNNLEFLKEYSFYLSGGTGLSLQIGHRRSFDFDFFSSKEFTPEELSSAIKQHKISVEGEMRQHGMLYCILDGVKSSFIFYEGRLIYPLVQLNTIYIADMRDIVVEKLRTVGDRGQKKDFYDLYYGVQKLGIDTVAGLAYKKFGKSVNYLHLLKGITYFKDAEKNPDPMLLDKSVAWEDIKAFLISHALDFNKAFEHIFSQ